MNSGKGWARDTSVLYVVETDYAHVTWRLQAQRTQGVHEEKGSFVITAYEVPCAAIEQRFYEGTVLRISDVHDL
jgi:hypothetical protein